MIKMFKEEFDRLMEISPDIPDKIISKFKYQFKIKESYDKIKKPEICDILIPSDDFKNHWNDKHTSVNIITNTVNPKQTIYDNFIKKFTEINNREPTQDEIISNLNDTLDIDFIKNNFINNIV
jgi:hypothetical protein